MPADRDVVVDGVRIAYRERGRPDRPTVVLLHALGRASDDWDPVIERLGDSFHTIAVDFRGHGESDWPADYSFAAMCSDVIGLIDALGLASFALVGHSMGGVVAYMIASRRPDAVWALVVEDVAPPYPRDQALPVAPPSTEELDFDWDVVPSIVSEVNAGSDELWTALADISAPTLVIGGGHDSHIPQEKLRDVELRIVDCELATIPVGHHVHSAEPERFATLVSDWLRR